MGNWPQRPIRLSSSIIIDGSAPIIDGKLWSDASPKLNMV